MATTKKDRVGQMAAVPADEKVSTVPLIIYPCGQCDFLGRGRTVSTGLAKLKNHVKSEHDIPIEKILQDKTDPPVTLQKEFRCYLCRRVFTSLGMARCHVEDCEMNNGLTSVSDKAFKNIPL